MSEESSRSMAASDTHLIDPTKDAKDASGDDSPRIEPLREEGDEHDTKYRLYRARWVGLVAMVLLNAGAGMGASWFGPISTSTAAQFHISLTAVNWLANIVQLATVLMCLLTPLLYKGYGMKMTCMLGSALLVFGAWLRYAAAPTTLSPKGAYTILIFGNLFTGAAQSIFLALGPKYSELWFDLKGRTTATMIISLCNPIGTAIGQIISPITSSVRASLLILAVASSALAVPSLLMKDKPPTPPTFAGSKPTLGPMVTVRAMMFRERPEEKGIMDFRDKLDFILIGYGFGVYVGEIVAFSLLSNQILAPYGYSENTAGFMGAALILSGLVAAAVTAPLFDRVLTHRLAFCIRVSTPFISVGWFSLIWAVRVNNAGALYAIFAIIGVISLTLLPVTLELASEVTRNSETSSAILWGMGNLMPFIFIIVQNALRAGPDANPPRNMHRALIFNGIFSLTACIFVQFIRGKQSRRKLDEEMIARGMLRPGSEDGNRIEDNQANQGTDV